MLQKVDIRLLLLVCHSLSFASSSQAVPFKNTINSVSKSAESIKQALSPQMIDSNDPDPNDPADGCRDLSLHKCGSSMVRVFRLLDYLPWQKSYSAKCSLRKRVDFIPRRMVPLSYCLGQFAGEIAWGVALIFSAAVCRKNAENKAFFSCMKTEDRPCKKRHWRSTDNRFRKKLARSLWSTRGCVLGALPNGTHI